MKKILIALSSEFTLEILKANFLKEGFQVATVNNGEDALNFIKDNTPDVVLADANLPMLDAFELLDKIKENESTKRLPVIIYSRTGSEKQYEDAMDHEARDFIVAHSTSPENIVIKIKSILGEERSYSFGIENNLEQAKIIAHDLGIDDLKCPNCGKMLSLHLLRNLSMGKNNFKVSFVCPYCSSRHQI